jgi:Spy/CpxP family protein refolding chaperone
MTRRFQLITLGAGAMVLALGALGVAVLASTHHNTAVGLRSFMGRRPLFARSDGPEGGFRASSPAGPLGMMRMGGSRLGLSDAQKGQIKGIAQSHRDEWRALAERAVSARQALHSAIAADTIDETAIRQRSAEVAAVEADIAVARAHVRAEMFKLLTPEQQEKAKARRHGRA